MKAFIYTGGPIWPDCITEHPKTDNLRVAADSGYSNARTLGERIDVCVGDFDSLGEENIPKDTEIVRLKCEKDATDTMVAVELAIERGADDIVIVGGLSGRLDHTLANLSVLEDLSSRGIYAIITDGHARVRFIRNSSVLIARSYYKYLSVIAADDKVRGLSIDGCRYPLTGARLDRRRQYAVSNEISGNCALIAVKHGGIYVIESRD